MLHKENPDYNRGQFGFYSLEDLVPQDYLLRQIEEAIDFSFIYDLVADSYSDDTGRPCLEPILLIKNSNPSVSLRHSFHASNH